MRKEEVIKQIDHIEVLTRDIDRTVDFYVNTLGFKLSRKTLGTWPDGRSWKLACVTLGEMMVEVLQARPEVVDEPAEQSRVGMRMFALRVGDMAKTIEELERKGVEISRPPVQTGVFEGLRAEMLDPNGIPIELREWQRGDGIHNHDWESTMPGYQKIS